MQDVYEVEQKTKRFVCQVPRFNGTHFPRCEDGCE